MPDEGAAGLTNDLRQVYVPDEVAAGIGREQLQELIGLYRGKVLALESIQTSCEWCQNLGQKRWCKHWRDTVPDEAVEAGCEAWRWSGVRW